MGTNTILPDERKAPRGYDRAQSPEAREGQGRKVPVMGPRDRAEYPLRLPKEKRRKLMSFFYETFDY